MVLTQFFCITTFNTFTEYVWYLPESFLIVYKSSVLIQILIGVRFLSLVNFLECKIVGTYLYTLCFMGRKYLNSSYGDLTCKCNDKGKYSVMFPWYRLM